MNPFFYFIFFIILLKSTTPTYNGYLNRRLFTKSGSCGFGDYYDISNKVAAISSENYENSLVCGGCVRIKNSKGYSLRVKIIDKCLNCEKNSLEISYNDYEYLKKENKNEQKISWDWVPCYAEGNFLYYFDKNAGDYYITFQVRNTSMRIKNVIIYNDINDSWDNMGRREDYFFYYIPENKLQNPLLVKIESINGEIVNDIIANFENGKLIKGSAKFSENGDKNFGEWICFKMMKCLLLVIFILV